MAIYYRLIEDDFSDEAGQNWIVDCLIQTEDPADFGDFDEALAECMERIQERIDAQEDAEGDDGHLKRLREKLGDTGEAVRSDWEQYESCLSQPSFADPRSGDDDPKYLTVSAIEARKTARKLIDEGLRFGPNHNYIVSTVEKYERLAAIGAGGPKVRVKRFKERPRPPMTLSKVKVSPSLLQALPTELIRGLLIRHRQSWEGEGTPYSPLHDAYTTRMSGPDESMHYYVITMFILTEDLTFATSVPKRFPTPGDRQITSEASEAFEFDDEAESVVDPWNPSMN